jgi:hypothetical protein
VERKVKVPTPDGKIVEGWEVPVAESIERWTEAKLEDGSVLRIKPSIISAIRVPGQFDPEGNPMYILRATNTVMIVEASELHKKRPAGVPAKAN